jgi:hypothetical protein
MGGTCNTYRREERFMEGLWGNMKEKEKLEDPGANGKAMFQ